MANSPKPHKVVLKNSGGGVEVQPLKPWFRLHTEYWDRNRGIGPNGEGTSHEMRRVLQKHGFVVQIRPNDVLIIKPTDDGDISFVDEVTGDTEAPEADVSQDDLEEPIEITFGLERDMQAALRSNIEQLESNLRIIDGGHEKTTGGGRIDITAEDSTGNIVVIELKAGTARPEAITQLLAYMGTVTEEPNMAVRGNLVAGDFHPRVLLAAKALPNVRLMSYSFNFRFDPA